MPLNELNKLQNNGITSLHKYKTYFNADSVEWCPYNKFENIFVCANYQLNKGDGSRIGKILLFSLEIDGLKLHHDLNTSAVLDQKWCFTPINNNILLGVVNSSSQLLILKLDTSNLKLEKFAHFEFPNKNTDLLILSLDWSDRIISSNEPRIVCTDTGGNVHILKLECDKLILELSLKSHEFEVWIGGFYYWDPNIFFSGGDDSLFHQYDIRVGQKVATNKKHDAGVTSFHSNPKKEFLVASGSYDERIRLWDIRSLKSSVVTKESPGTLFRLKWDPFSSNYLLAACMLGGLHIFEDKSDDLKMVNSFYDHTDIVYGADWSFIEKHNTKYSEEDCCIIASCSFYDNMLFISKSVL